MVQIVTSMFRPVAVTLLAGLVSVAAQGQSKPPATSTNATSTTPTTSTTPPTTRTSTTALPSDYVIGIDDVLAVVFWKERDLSAEVVVRPDGKISLPMLNDIQAAGLTPEQLSASIEKAALKFVRDPGATVIVKAIRSRRVYVIGEVAKPGVYQLSSDMNVLQLLGEAGGLLEHANKSDIVIVRKESSGEQRIKFNYNEVVRGRNTQQNIRLQPGDTILVR